MEEGKAIGPCKLKGKCKLTSVNFLPSVNSGCLGNKVYLSFQSPQGNGVCLGGRGAQGQCSLKI